MTYGDNESRAMKLSCERIFRREENARGYRGKAEDAVYGGGVNFVGSSGRAV